MNVYKCDRCNEICQYETDVMYNEYDSMIPKTFNLCPNCGKNFIRRFKKFMKEKTNE